MQALDDKCDPIVGILSGPTASGKSSLAVELALLHDLAIISADSMQVYRGMEIGTGAIPTEERRGVPHYLIGVVEPSERFEAARFVREARQIALHEWRENRRRSLIVGGTGMWLQALREGLFAGPGRDEELRLRLLGRLEAEGSAALHAELAGVDPVMAARLHSTDTVRIVRALEVYESSGRPLSDWHAEDAARRAALTEVLPLVAISPQRPLLNRRIEERVGEMIGAGWVDEARILKEMKLGPDAPARKALGYRELYRLIDGEWSLEEAVTEIVRATRKYARRQMTWFRGQRDVIMPEAPTTADLESAFRL